jgi:MoaA/NifB/PqqE/SkfB family radical SAM enzyme
MLKRKYYCPAEAASLLESVRNRLLRKPVPAFPRTIAVETQSGCNARCVFCSYTSLRNELPMGRMEMALFEKLARECAGRKVERFILCLDNEPLLDPDLAERFLLLRKYCPRSARNLTTNASLLTREKIEELAGSGAVNEIFLSVNGFSKEVYEELMGLPFEQTMANLYGLSAWLREHPRQARRLRVQVNVVKTRRVAPELAPMRRRWQEEAGFRLHVIDLDNRGNQVDLRGFRALQADDADLKPYRACRRPCHTLVITWEGKAVLCCVDYRREVVLGDLVKQSLAEIWNGPRAVQLRREFLAGDFTNLALCRRCRVN